MKNLIIALTLIIVIPIVLTAVISIIGSVIGALILIGAIVAVPVIAVRRRRQPTARHRAVQ